MSVRHLILCFAFWIIPASNNNSPPLAPNEYRLPVATGSQVSTGRATHRQLPSLPVECESRGQFSLGNREPPPPYWAPYRNQSNQLEPQRVHRQRRPAPPPPTRAQINQIAIRSRVEQYRNRISVSDTESDDDLIRRSRILSPRRTPNGFKNEVLLGKSALRQMPLINFSTFSFVYQMKICSVPTLWETASLYQLLTMIKTT
jgi:hypothetical protein